MLPPPGWTLSVCECDPQAAGALRLVWKSAEADPAGTLYGVFTDAAPHERIVHTEMMAMGSGETVGTQVETHEFAEKGGITTMRITQAYDSKAARDGAVASGMEHGIEAGFKQMNALLAQPA